MHRPTDHEFTPDNYEGFYEHHFFAPIPEADALHANRKIARVGWALDIAREIQPRHIVDLGCLDGSLILTLVSHLNDEGGSCTGIGVDLSQEGTDLATDRAAKFEVPATFIKGSIEAWLKDAESDSVGMITLFEIIEHVEDPDAVIAEIKRVLAPGGTLLASTPAFESPYYGMDDEQNKCHVRLYTVQPENYKAVNKFDHEREATSMPQQLKDFHIESMDVFSELIHARAVKK